MHIAYFKSVIAYYFNLYKHLYNLFPLNQPQQRLRERNTSPRIWGIHTVQYWGIIYTLCRLFTHNQYMIY